MRAYFGPSPFAPFPVIATEPTFTLDPQVDLERIRHRIEAAFPGWLVDCPATHESTPAHALASIAACWCKGVLNSVRGVIPGSGATLAENGSVVLWVGFHVPQITARAITLSAQVIHAASAPGNKYPDGPLEKKIQELQDVCRREHPDYIARILMLAANARGLPWLRSPMGRRHWQYGWGCNGRVFMEASPVRESARGIQIARNKALTTQVLRALGFPVTDHLLATTVDEAVAHARTLGMPVVVKPIDQGQGRGVTVGVSTEAAITKAFAIAKGASNAPILIERFVNGIDHRLLVVRGKLIAAVRREPAIVVGNGVDTVRELISKLNAYRQSQPRLARYLKMIKGEPAVLDHLASQQLTLDSVPHVGRRVALRSNANVSTGGSPTDVLKLLHPDIRSLAEAVAVNLGLESAGVDYITSDVRQSWRDVGGCIVEVNATPGLDLHVAASMREEEIGQLILGPEVARVPIVVVVATVEDQTKLLAELDRRSGSLPLGTGIVGPDFVRVNGLLLEIPGSSIHDRTIQILANRQTTGAVLAVSPDVIQRSGLPVDQCDLCVVRGRDGADGKTTELLRRYSTVFVDASSEPAWPSTGSIDRIISALRPGTSLAMQRVSEPDNPERAITPTPRHQTVGLARLEVVKRHHLSRSPALFSIMRNERYLLPWFLSHYRALNIENFVIYDDHSDDGTRELLEQQPDCTVLTSSNRFNDRLSNGLQFHHYLRDAIAENLGKSRWVLAVDADEFLFLPQLFANLPDLYSYLDKKGHHCVFGPMIDFYPRRLADRNHDVELSPFEVSRYFDRDKSFRRIQNAIRPEKCPGGIRARLQRWLQEKDPELYDSIYKGRGYKMAAMYKVPLVKTGHNITRRNSHTVSVRPPDDIELCMAHFKFIPDLDQKIKDALDQKQHYLGSIEYRFLQAVVSIFGDADLVSDNTILFTGRESLEAAGHMKCDPGWSPVTSLPR